MKSSLAGLTLVGALMMGAQAQTVQQKDLITGDKAEVAEYAKSVNAACGSHIGFSVNYVSFGKDGGVSEGHRPSQMIQAAGDALKETCSTSKGQKEVQRKVHSVRLVYGNNEGESLASGVFTYKVGYGGGHPGEWLKAHMSH